MGESEISRELGEIHARLNAIDKILAACNFEIAVEGLNKADILNDRFERHLSKIESQMNRIDDKISKALEKSNMLEIGQKEQESKFIKLFYSSSGMGFFGGSLSMGLLELVKLLNAR